MKCQKCGKDNANIIFTRIINGNRADLYICDECAQKMNFETNTEFYKMFSNFINEFARVGTFAIPKFKMLDGFINNDFFSNNYYLENEEPYIEFDEDEVSKALNKIQQKYKKENKNIEKTQDKTQTEIAKLKEKMEEYIKNEEYEKAAVLRDKIKELSDK